MNHHGEISLGHPLSGSLDPSLGGKGDQGGGERERINTVPFCVPSDP